MKGRAAASPQRAGVAQGAGDPAARERGAPSVRCRSRAQALALLAGMAVALRCALVPAQTGTVPAPDTTAPAPPAAGPEQALPAPAPPSAAPEQTLPAPAPPPAGPEHALPAPAPPPTG